MIIENERNIIVKIYQILFQIFSFKVKTFFTIKKNKISVL